MTCEKTIPPKSDIEFAGLIQPFSNEEIRRLSSVLTASEPLVFYTWNDILIDDTGYYKLSLQFGIPHEIRPLPNKTREEIIIDICGKQLGRDDLTIVMRKYLIGKMSLAEQLKNELSINSSGAEFTKTEIRDRIGKKYAYGFSSVRDFEIGSSVIDKIFMIDQTVAENILSEKTDISYNCLISMSKLPFGNLKNIINNLSKNEFDMKKFIKSVNERHKPRLKSGVSVKVTPGYDLDAEISSLTLTIPSWINSIKKAQKAITCQISTVAAEKLFDKLSDLNKSIEQIMNSVTEVV